MDFLELAKDRYSVRKFLSREVEQEKIDKILEAGNVAPTACNFQPQVIYVIKSSRGLEKLQKCKFSHFGETLAFLICYDEKKCWFRSFDNKPSGEIDASIVATHMMIEAWNEGIGSTWIMHFDPEAIKTEFDIPTNVIPVCLLVMGYADSTYQPSKLHFENKDKKDIIIQ